MSYWWIKGLHDDDAVATPRVLSKPVSFDSATVCLSPCPTVPARICEYRGSTSTADILTTY